MKPEQIEKIKAEFDELIRFELEINGQGERIYTPYNRMGERIDVQKIHEAYWKFIQSKLAEAYEAGKEDKLRELHWNNEL